MMQKPKIYLAILTIVLIVITIKFPDQGAINAQADELQVWHAWHGEENLLLEEIASTYYYPSKVNLIQFDTQAALFDALQKTDTANHSPDLFLGPNTWIPSLIDSGIITAYCLPGQCPECQGLNPPPWCPFAHGDFSGSINNNFIINGLCEPEQCPPCYGPNQPRWCWRATLDLLTQLDIFQAEFADIFDDEIFPIGIPIWWDYTTILANPAWFTEHQEPLPTSITDIIDLVDLYPEMVYIDPPLIENPGSEPIHLLVEAVQGNPSPQPSHPGILVIQADQFHQFSLDIDALTPLPLADYHPQPIIEGIFMNHQTSVRSQALDFAYAVAYEETQEQLFEIDRHLPTHGEAWQSIADKSINDFGKQSMSIFLGAPPAEEDFFYTNGEKIPATIALNQIGVLAFEGVTAEQIADFADQFNLHLICELSDNLFILGLNEPENRDTLVTLARKLENQGEQLVVQAGLLTTLPGAEDPMILTDQFIVEFEPQTMQTEIDALNNENQVEILMENPFVQNQFLLTVTETSQADGLTMANLYHENDLAQFAHPNFIQVIDQRESIPDDPLFVNQWHHRNAGLSGGTPDADIDTSWAWDITQGEANVVIAVIDGGFDMTHPDLLPNYWVNPGEIASDGMDNDGNGFIDDINGWDFTDCAVTGSSPPCGDNDPAGLDTRAGSHGTSVAGVAAARGDNTLGVSGSCPNCRILTLRYGSSAWADGLAFGYARQMGADIITNSWGYSIGIPCLMNVCNAINDAATNGRGGLGSVIFFAMNNPNVNDCIGSSQDISSLPNVIAVSRSTNRDQFDFSGFGNCMDLLAPTAGSAGRGTLWIATTDMQGNAGYNNTVSIPSCPSTEPEPPPANARDYTFCFGGTSSATPLVAGVAGLLLDVNPSLTRLQVQQLLQDTADKIEDSIGHYDSHTGFSSPPTGQATHGYGRTNAFEAVRVAAPIVDGGKGGVDLFFRDNRLDWGNTTGYLGEQGSSVRFEPSRGHIGAFRSMDIKVDAGPAYRLPPTAETFDSFVDENPSASPGDINRVYVRIRNRGAEAASAANIKLLWAQYGTALPRLPSDFWTAYPNNSALASGWNSLNCAETTSPYCTVTNVEYSGSSVAGTADDGAQIVRFDFPAPEIDPRLDNHFCILAIVDSPQDEIDANSKARFIVDTITPNDNNVTHRNYHNLDPTISIPIFEHFVVRNPFDFSIETALTLENPNLGQLGWIIDLEPFKLYEPFTLKPQEEIVVKMTLTLPQPNVTGELTIFQERIDDEETEIIGGLTYYVRPQNEIYLPIIIKQ